MKKQIRMLIIDDCEEILTTLAKFFKKKRYEVVTASNGFDGLKLIEADDSDYNIVITDIVIPHVSGVGLISILKKKHPDIPVIAITGWGEHPEALAAEAQADLILEKPIDFFDLENHVNKLVKISS